MTFKLRSGNKPQFKQVGSSPTKYTPKKVWEEHTKKVWEDDDCGKLQEERMTEFMRRNRAPVKQRLKKGGEAQDEDKIFNEKGEHVGDWVDGKKVRTKEQERKTLQKMFDKVGPVIRPKRPKYKERPKTEESSPAKQKKDKEIKVKTDHTKLYGLDWKAPVRASGEKYWYKINDKHVTKAAYLKYQNKPGGDEPGKQTNDPDAYGYKAARKKARAKLKTKK